MRRAHRLSQRRPWWWCCRRPKRRSPPFSGSVITCECRSSRVGREPDCRAAPRRIGTGVTLSLAKFNRILKIDPASCTAVVQCGVRNTRHQRGRRAVWSVLRAGPEQPDRLHHRRQCGRELRRRALSEIRTDPAQCASSARLHGGRRRRWNSDRKPWMPRVSICSPWSSAAKACWPSPPK